MGRAVLTIVLACNDILLAGVGVPVEGASGEDRGVERIEPLLAIATGGDHEAWRVVPGDAKFVQSQQIGSEEAERTRMASLDVLAEPQCPFAVLAFSQNVATATMWCLQRRAPPDFASRYPESMAADFSMPRDERGAEGRRSDPGNHLRIWGTRSSSPPTPEPSLVLEVSAGASPIDVD